MKKSKEIISDKSRKRKPNPATCKQMGMGFIH